MSDPIRVDVDSPMPEWNVVLVGGNDDIYQQMKRKLAPLNICIGAWWESSRGVQTRVPERCNGMLILKDFVSHTLAEQAKACAELSGVKWAYITRKWAQTSTALAATGFISPAIGLEPHTTWTGRKSKVGNKLVRSFVSQTTGKRVTVEQGGRLLSAILNVSQQDAKALGDVSFETFVAAALHDDPRFNPPVTPQVTLQVTTEVTAQEEPEPMSKPALTVNVQTIPLASSKPSRADLIEALKLTALELMTAHGVVDIRISETDGIQIRVMEQLNVKL